MLLSPVENSLNNGQMAKWLYMPKAISGSDKLIKNLFNHSKQQKKKYFGQFKKLVFIWLNGL